MRGRHGLGTASWFPGILSAGRAPRRTLRYEDNFTPYSFLSHSNRILTVSQADKTSAFPAGINAAATFSRKLLHARGSAIGAEFHGKGVDVALGPSVGPLGLFPEGGRNWEGFGSDPYLAGVGVAETVKGIQEQGVMSCVKHYILNEQEHFRGSVSAEVDDRVMHEVFLW